MERTASGSVAVPVLNSFIFSTTRKEDVSSFIILSRELVECADSPDEKQLRHIQQYVLPRLAYFEALPVAVLSPLVSIARHAAQSVRKDHKKLLRMLYYHIHVLLSCGRAGTTGPKDADDPVSAALLPPHVLKDYWQTFSTPSKDIAQIVACLHLLSGILRGVRHSNQKNKQKAQQERVVLTGKFVGVLTGILSNEYQPPRGDKKGLFKTVTRPAAEEEESKALIQKEALAAVRASLPVKEQRKLMPNVFNVLKNHQSLDGVSMRHILALAADSCQKSTSVFIQELKFRLEATLDAYGPSGFVFPYLETSSAKADGPNGSSPPLLLSDPFCRKYLAQACGIVVREMGKKAKGTVFWNALVMMACGDPHLMVASESLKALLGARPEKSPDLFSAAKPKIVFEVDIHAEAQEKESCLVAWQSLMKEEIPSALISQEGSKKRTVLAHCIDRLHEALSQGSHSVIAGICRVICAMGRCFAYAVAAKPNQKMWHRATSMLNPLRDALLHFATSSGPYSSAIQYLSLKALIWLQGMDGGPLTPPIMARILSNGPCWAEDLMSDILQTLFHRFTVQPSMSAYILDCVSAAVAGNPVHVVPVELVDFWFYSVEHSDKAQVLNAALQFLEAPLPPRALSLQGDLGVVSEAISAWRKLKRTVTLWLGNAIAFLAEDHPWQERSAVSLGLSDGLSTSDLLSTEVTQSPLLMSTVSHFVHDLTTGSWESRLAAAKALTCIAIQCQEPYRIQIYGVFKAMLHSEDVFGLGSELSKVVELLDHMYSGQMMIDTCVHQWGGNFASWPPEMAEAVRQRHTQLLDAVLVHCQVPTDLFFPLGPKSRALILGEEVPEMMQSQGSIGFEPHQAQYSDYLRQGSQQIDEGYEIEPVDSYSNDWEPQAEADQMDQFLRGSQRTRDYLNKPSLKDMVAQSVQAEPYSAEQTAPDGSPEYGVERYEAEEKGSYGEAVVTPTPYSYDAPSPSDRAPWESSPNRGESTNQHPSCPSQPVDLGSGGPWESSLDKEESYGGYPSEEPRTLGDTGTSENPFHHDEQSYDVGFSPSHHVQIQEGFPKRAAVLFDFEAEMEGELTVNLGDIITVLSELEGGWYLASVENVLGIKNEGIVPCDYVELQED